MRCSLQNIPFNYSISDSNNLKPINEAMLAEWWNYQIPGSVLKSMDGKDFIIAEGGCLNPYDGPDVEGAVLFYKSEFFKGDVEFHLYEKDWTLHRHHLNERFNNVVLHIVCYPNNSRATRKDGIPVPCVIVPIEELLRNNNVLCRLKKPLSDERVNMQLMPFISARWIEKVNSMKEVIRTAPNTENIFYRLTLESLGLKGNRKFYRRIGENISFRFLSKLTSEMEIEAVLKGAGGLFGNRKAETSNNKQGLGYPPNISQGSRGNKEKGKKILELQSVWGRIKKQFGLKEVVSPKEWKRKGIRPAAYPEKRLEGAVKVVQLMKKGWNPWKDDKPVLISQIEKLFEDVPVGQGWMVEWLGNTVLPIQEAWHILNNCDLSTCRFSAWQSLTLGYTYGKISRKFAPYISKKSLTHFSIQQGLLILQHQYCSQGLCTVCPLRR
tara:strand:+ start:1526 stop:2839 length:1314 start_codon:yes stop_codon:yes gene_type:complete